MIAPGIVQPQQLASPPHRAALDRIAYRAKSAPAAPRGTLAAQDAVPDQVLEEQDGDPI